MIAVAAFLPWASIFGLSVNGISGDGKITLVFLALAALFGFATQTGLTGNFHSHLNSFSVSRFSAPSSRCSSRSWT